MSELYGKGWRVLGYFIWMLGAGMVLDRDAVGVGGLLLSIGLLMFLGGTVQSWRRSSGTPGNAPHA